MILTPIQVKEFLVSKKFNPSYPRAMKAHHPETYNYILNLYPFEFSENIYLYYTETKKGDYLCKNCDNTVRFVNCNEGYKIFCGKSCDEKYKTVHSKLNTQSLTPPTLCDCGHPVIKNKNGLWSHYCSHDCRGKYNSLNYQDKSKKTMLANSGYENYKTTTNG